ncbi:uncharacterized protein Z520_00069 [Fonsecaea multimorphosa CBS 102226]|uniref:Carboxylic ester hydrolase n=1 Tax=Fonsecaea multimorphosa CBS 102226 TaxID=1442371 RepID=A0A0D2KBG8_9EURO|nr:uncharacterized protein Z520_00069 [Fonsecaea multimorphosa CBS 102226]KIY03378.1 hypothetical protein Z520_00069 [Fonsecaea multimorphosa CBS 102226]OAL33028.1 hypothetical protein AYO22_00113 [Fonsecaea multimorphosa]
MSSLRKHSVLSILIFGLAALASSTEGAPGGHNTACTALTKPSIAGASVLSFQSQHLPNATVLASPPLLNNNFTRLDICSVDLVISHQGAHDKVKIKVWLPATGWNRRFVGTGGSGYAAGFFEYSLAPVVALGYAAASTDAGLSGDPYSPGAWALHPNNTVNDDLLLNFASRSVHDMAVAGKVIATQYYGRKPARSYWTGCSTGGRQGLVAAQKHPHDFDGIVAGAPAIDWARYVVAEQWPQVVMKEEGTYISQCVLQAFTNASIAACDALDGVADGVITDLQDCRFDPFTLVGTSVQCDGGREETITRTMTNVVGKILAGPQGPSISHPYALNPGAALDSLANTTVAANGTRVGAPFFVNAAWIKYFVKKDPDFDTSAIGYAGFETIFNQSQQDFGPIIGSYDPNLSAFRAAGGKAIVWHGLADQLIFPHDTVAYHQKVIQTLGNNASAVAEFYRTFLAPGVDHCGAGPTAPGAVPVDPLAAVVAWVEQQKAPDVLEARKTAADGTVVFTRNLCPFPQTSRYRGTGNTSLASSYNCA